MRLNGNSKSDWKAAAALSNDEIEAAIADDGDEAGIQVDWSKVLEEPPHAATSGKGS